MRRAGSAAWRMSVDRWPERLDMALWFRAAERIDVRAGGVVPGPLDIEPMPDPSTDSSDAAELAEGWFAWWRWLVGAPKPRVPFDSYNPLLSRSFAPPDFSGLHDWPVLRRAVADRWRKAHQWHSARKHAGLESGAHHDMRPNRVVDGVENALGRRAQPFSLEFVLLPVHDEEIRPVGPHRYLVPERVHDGPRWPDLLRELVIPIA